MLKNIAVLFRKETGMPINSSYCIFIFRYHNMRIPQYEEKKIDLNNPHFYCAKEYDFKLYYTNALT